MGYMLFSVTPSSRPPTRGFLEASCIFFAKASTLLLSLGQDYACKALVLQEESHV